MKYIIVTVMLLQGCVTGPNFPICGMQCETDLAERRQADMIEPDWYANGGPGTTEEQYLLRKLGRQGPRTGVNGYQHHSGHPYR